MQDQIGRPIVLSSVPQRIVSLCPSVTETLFSLGLRDRVVGRTSFCVHPREGVASVAKVGGTKTLNQDRLDATRPDLVIAVKEENVLDQIEECAKRRPTLVLDPTDFESALTSIALIGEATDRVQEGNEVIAEVRRAWSGVSLADGRRVLYLIWRDPLMAVSSGTYVDDVISRLGFLNEAHSLGSRYPEIPPEALLRPDLVLASSEPFPFSEKHRAELGGRFPRADIVLVDGEMFTWHGVRMIEAADYFRRQFAVPG